MFGVGTAVAAAMVGLADLEPGRPEVTRAAAVAVLMASWWLAGVVPLAVTSLMPVVLFPLLGVADGKEVSSHYFNHIIFLFIGGFIVALAMERWNLHKRIALSVLLCFGDRPRWILLGFMTATAFLSMWISNTATTMMMVPIVLAVIAKIDESSESHRSDRFATGLLLGVAYGASIGGIATLVGTPPNMVLTKIFEMKFPDAPQIDFASWFLFGFPISLIMLAGTWCLLARFCVGAADHMPMERDVLRRQRAELGRLTFPEWVVLGDFCLLIVLWLFRRGINVGSFQLAGWSSWFAHPEYINDGTVAVAAAALLFFIPAGRGRSTRVMDWRTAGRLPWEIVLLFGGGFALAGGIEGSGLSDFLGRQLQGLSFLHPILLVALCCLGITFLTEITSNTATANMVLPVMASLAVSIGVNPLLMMIPVTLSCSFAFMMPVATPPNAIVFGSRRLRISDMAKVGLIINLLGVLVILIGICLLGPIVWGIDVLEMPDWAAPAAG